MKRLFTIMTLVAIALSGCDKDETTVFDDYVDLGLPSGTLWKSTNELNADDPEYNFYTFDEAVARFGDNLPTDEQLYELIECCEWSFDNDRNIVTVTGPNGNSIELPRRGKRGSRGSIYFDGSDGLPASACYWSRTAIDDTYAWRLDTNMDISVYMYDGARLAGANIRLVKSR